MTVSLAILLLAYGGFALLGAVQQAWGWQLGETVRVKVDDRCSYFMKGASLADCTGSWTTADGKTHVGRIKGSYLDLNDGPASMRAFGDTAYTKPGAWTNSFGLPAPFAGALGLILLPLAFFIRPSRAERARARSQPLRSEILALAESRDLGAERGRYWKQDSASHGIMVFENGFVFSWPRDNPVAYGWDDVPGVFERTVQDGNKAYRAYVVWTGGDEWLTFAEHQVEDLPGLGRVLVESVSQRLRPKVLAALRQGGSYVFPRWGSASLTEFTATGVGGDDGIIPWSELAGVDVRDGRIVIRGKQQLVRSRTDTGNAEMLVVMLRSFIADRREHASPT